MMDLLNEMLPNKIWGAVEQWIVILIRGTEIYITFYPLHMHLQIMHKTLMTLLPTIQAPVGTQIKVIHENFKVMTFMMLSFLHMVTAQLQVQMPSPSRPSLPNQAPTTQFIVRLLFHGSCKCKLTNLTHS